MLEAPRDPSNRVFYRIFNSDGGEVEQCGNGARCIAALLYASAPQLGREIAMESKAGPVHACVRPDGLVSVDMGAPAFDPASIPLDAPAEAVELLARDRRARAWSSARYRSATRTRCCASQDVKTAPVAQLGPAIERHPRFPRRTNVGFMQIVDRSAYRVCECSSAASARLSPAARAPARPLRSAAGRAFSTPDVRVDLPGGTAQVSWAGTGEHAWLTGPATTVFSGIVDI